MNAVEIEQAITKLAEQPFDPIEFPYEFLEAFGNKESTIKRLRTNGYNKSDLGGVLQTNNIHILVCDAGLTTNALQALRLSPGTAKSKAKFVLATDGVNLEAESLITGETLVCAFPDLPDHFGFFLPLAGISTIRQISENAFDIRATGRLNKLYVELLKDNPEWGTSKRRHDMNHFMARLIFCFFAENTDIFGGKGKFTATIDQMSMGDASNTHEVIATLFLSLNTKWENRAAANIPRWANDNFPYVNGGLFYGNTEVPKFSRAARSYLLHIGSLDWTKINPDIFGSMIQSVADEAERSHLGMHYTSVPNILKVLNPLFLDDLRARLDEAGDNPRTLLNLRKRMARIRVFDPACGSGNFLVIAYKEMRAIEAEINKRRSETGRASELPLTNFRGIELRDFSAEIARLALIIAEYQCDVLYRGQNQALADFLPLRNENWITCGNALRLDWLRICPPTGTGVKLLADDLFGTPLEQIEIDFENEGGETYICGNPPYLGSTWQTKEQKADLQLVFAQHTRHWGSLDYVAGWFMKAADFCTRTEAAAAFVSTNSICQGQQVPILWPMIFTMGNKISFAHTSFKWSNLASHNAGVTVVIVGMSPQAKSVRRLYSIARDGENDVIDVKEVEQINAYLVSGVDVMVQQLRCPLGEQAEMTFGNKPVDGGHLLLDHDELQTLDLTADQSSKFIRKIMGSAQFIRGLERYCLWIEDADLEEAMTIYAIRTRIDRVRDMRMASRDSGAKKMAAWAHQFREMNIATQSTIIVPIVSSESRQYLPVGLLPRGTIVSNLAFALYDAPFWNLAIIASRLHLVWIATVCGKLKTDFRYSNTLGWNTFPMPSLTEKNKEDLTRSAEDILLAREHHYPSTIADLYKPDAMPADLRAAHDRNDEVLERIFIGRRFKNDTERLEKLFDLYAKMTVSAKATTGKKRKTGANV